MSHYDRRFRICYYCVSQLHPPNPPSLLLQRESLEKHSVPQINAPDRAYLSTRNLPITSGARGASVCVRLSFEKQLSRKHRSTELQALNVSSATPKMKACPDRP